MSNKRILITGAGGFLGSHLTRRLHREGHRLAVLASPRFDPRRLGDLAGELRVFHADLTSASSVAEVVARVQPELVYHLASTPFNPPPAEAATHWHVIAGGTFHLLEALRGSRARLVYTGSAAEYGSGSGLTEDSPLRPATMLGVAKAAASLLVQTYARLVEMETVVLRLFTPYGPWESPARLIPYTVLQALHGQPVRLGGGSQQRDFVYIDDVIDALMRAGFGDLPPAAVFNISSGQGRPVREVAAAVLEIMGNPVPLETGTREDRSDEIRECSGDNTRARVRLGWEPGTSLAEGLRRTIEWFRENPQWAASSR